ncbi:MAG: Chromosome-partitioning protein Spo0J [Syntrophorhabdus sp. PtaB.Bin184]|nr:MAG: Chromosome-partitioning protein Spo0J [Syntrophorhabdus sp. PtaB.Bin184]
MKYLGCVKVSLLREKPEYTALFPPLSDAEYHDLRESIKEAGILNDLILEKDGDGYIILAGHHRKKAAIEEGLEEVPCSLAETRAEILEALFDNASRRQMTEAERKEKVREKERVQDRMDEENLIPELYALYKEGKIDRRSIDKFLREDHDLQRSIFYSLSIERPVVPPEVLEKHEQEISSLESRHKEDLDLERKKLAEAEAELAAAEEEKKKAQEALEQHGKELEKIRKKAKDTLAEYQKNKEEITEEVKQVFEKDLENLRMERERREAAMKEKQNEIAKLNGEIESFKNRIYGFEGQVALWRHEIARVSELYDKNIAYYSNPALLEVQLQVISEFVESLVRFSECHKWNSEASRTVERYQKSIDNLLRRLVKEVKSRQKEAVSVEESEKAIAAQAPVKPDDQPTAP